MVGLAAWRVHETQMQVQRPLAAAASVASGHWPEATPDVQKILQQVLVDHVDCWVLDLGHLHPTTATEASMHRVGKRIAGATPYGSRWMAVLVGRFTPLLGRGTPLPAAPGGKT